MSRHLQALARFVLVCASLALWCGFAPKQPVSAASTQTAGDELWDDRFGMPGVTNRVSGIAVASDGSMYAISDERAVMRWDGRSWQNLGQTGSGFISAIATIGNTPYVAGSFTSIGAAPVKYLAKWDGSAWQQVGDGTGPQILDASGTNDGYFNALASANGMLYVGGRFNRVDGVNADSIAVWNGTTWDALGNGVHRLSFEQQPTEIGDVQTIVPADGKLYVGGVFQTAGDAPAGSIAVWDGSAWAALGGAVLQDNGFGSLDPGRVSAIAVSGSTVYAGGQFTQVDGKAANNIAKWSDSSWSALGQGITGSSGSTMGVRALLLDGSNLLVGGEFSAAGGQAVNNFARWDGTTWKAAAELRNDTVVNALVPTSCGYYIGGDFYAIDGMFFQHVARNVGGSWQALGQGLTQGNNICCAGTVYATVDDGAGHVFVGGHFQYAGGVAVNNIAMWDGARWQPLGTGVDGGDVRALLLLGSELYVGGTFKTAGGASIPYIAKWDTNAHTWSALGGGVDRDVYALEEADGVLYVGGDMSSAGGVKVSNIAAWDGTKWSALSSKLVIRQIFDNCSEAGSQVYAIKASGRYLAIAGNFRLVQIGFDAPCAKSSYFPANHIVLWDRVADEWFFLGKDGTYGVSGGDSFSPVVNALEVMGGPLEAGGALYVGGEFGQAGTVPAQGLARFKLSGWETFGGVSGGTSSAFSGPGVAALKAAGTDLYIGGNFTTAGSGGSNYIARYDTARSIWESLGSGVDHKVMAIDTAPDGLYIGGELSQAGGKASAGFARWGVPISTGNVNAEGGSVTGDGVQITFPAGAVSGSTNVVYTPEQAPTHPAPSGQSLVRAFRLDAKAANGQTLTQFAQPYTMRINYSDQSLAAAGIKDPATLKVVLWNGSGWVSLMSCQGCGVDTANKVITVRASQPGEFTVVGLGSTRSIFIPLVKR